MKPDKQTCLVSAPPEGERRVYILARKILLRNTRIFKQARTLTQAGYSVTLIGILPRDAPEREQREGYEIIRLPLAPVYVTLPRRLRKLRRSLELALLGIPRRYARAAVRIRRRRRLTWRWMRRPWRLVVAVEDRGLIVRISLKGRRRRYRLPLPAPVFRVLKSTADRRRVWRLTRRRYRRRLRYQVGRRLRLLRLRGRQIGAFLVRPLRLCWRGLGPFVRALIGPGGDAPPGTPLRTWVKIVGTPLALAARGLRGLNNLLYSAGWLLQRLAAWRNEESLTGRLLRAGVRALIRALRTTSEFLIIRLTNLLRRFHWPLKSFSYYRSVHRFVTSELAPPQVIHANDLDTLLIGVILARRYKVPLLYDAQELYTGVHTLPGWYRRVLTLQERLLVRMTDGITVVNDAIADVMASKYKIRIDSVVLNCPPLEESPRAAAGARTIRQIFDLPEDETVLLYSGALSKGRGIENTVRSLTHLNRASLVILGEGPLREELERLIQTAGLDGRVFFSDFVPHAEVPRFISSADFGVIPYQHVGVNHYLCSPSKLFHYMMAEVPVVCSDFPFLRKVVVANDVGAVFDPEDAASIAQAVRSIIDVPGAHAACRQRLRVVKRRYCWEEEEKRMMRVYEALDRREDAAVVALPMPDTAVR